MEHSNVVVIAQKGLAEHVTNDGKEKTTHNILERTQFPRR
jgi:hypothetical protein